MYKNPYQDLDGDNSGGKWYKVNFHTHAGTGPNTCGSNSIESVLDVYKKIKFDMICISNHDLFTDTSKFTNRNILLIPGVEYSQIQHMLTIGVNRSMHGFKHQQAIDATNGDGGFTILCHPNWTMDKHWRINDIVKFHGYTGIEVINMLIYRLGGSGLAADVWDKLLSMGKLVFGFGNDDFHILSDAGRSYNYIYCDERSVESMTDAVKAGRFCASTGLMPEYLKIKKGKIAVKAKYPEDTFINSFTYRFIGENGKILSVQTGGKAQYELDGEKEKYIRIEVTGENGALLFFQPIWLEGAFSPA